MINYQNRNNQNRNGNQKQWVHPMTNHCNKDEYKYKNQYNKDTNDEFNSNDQNRNENNKPWQ